jgi:hypothetical protein
MENITGDIRLPFFRTFRKLKTHSNSGYSQYSYPLDKSYANNPVHYTRAFLLLQEDIKGLFEYIEPADENLSTYSFRIYELMFKCCSELEANFKAILRENGYGRATEADWNMKDYSKVNVSHMLSGYKVSYPIWRGKNFTFQPFEPWGRSDKLAWYQAYNNAKHNRNESFEDANFQNLLSAFAGLFILMTAQFSKHDFLPGVPVLAAGGSDYYDGEFGIGSYLILEYPNWPDKELYNFDWSKLKEMPERFRKFDYNVV